MKRQNAQKKEPAKTVLRAAAAGLALLAGLSLGAPVGRAAGAELALLSAQNGAAAAALSNDAAGQVVSPYTGATYTRSREGVLSYGVDVSKWQGEIDWDAVAADGVRFAMIRCGYTGTGSAFTMNTDAYFAANVEGATAAGLDVGVYYFSQAATLEEAQQEAETTIGLLEPYRDKITLPVYFDLEKEDGYRVSGLTQAEATEAALTWLGLVADAGYQVGYYGGSQALPTLYDLSQLEDYPCWVARYNTSLGSDLNHVMWQYTAKGTVDGISGDVDCNFGYDLFPGEPEPEPPEPAPEPVSGWVKEDGVWYYYQNGQKATGWLAVNGYWYYLNDAGAMQTGWVKVSGKWYYMNSYGEMQTGWVKVNGYWYYLWDSGAMATGWVKVSGKWYYMNSYGEMQTGWVKVSGKWYYMNSYGEMQTGWVKVSGKWYYMNSYGEMQTGWLKLNGKWYYLDSSGAMVTGTVTIDGKRYTFNSSGVLQ